MCDNPNIVWLVHTPKSWFGNFVIKTRQYNEYAQFGKEYILFKSKKNWKLAQKFVHCQDVCLPCGKCVQCVNARSRNWSLRSSLELSKYNKSFCVTLTYNDDNLPEGGLLKYKDFQLFMKKLRNHISKECKQYNIEVPKIKYMVCGEYGKTSTLRPHFHAIIMGYVPNDINWFKPYKISRKGTRLYKSKIINELWSNGFVDIGPCSHQTCRYISQYCTKKLICYDKKYIEKCKQKKEFLHSSTQFGLDWFKANYHAIIEQSRIVLGGYVFGIPRYFIKKLEQINKRVYDLWKKKKHRFFLNYKFTEEEKRNQRAISDEILDRLKIFSGKGVDEFFLEGSLHNIHFCYQL